MATAAKAVVSTASFFGVLTARVTRSAFTFPSSDSWKGLLLSWIVMSAAFFGGAPAGIYKWQPLKDARSLGWAASYMTIRAVLEEVIFRALMLPHPKVDAKNVTNWSSFAFHAFFPLVLFTLSHLWTTQRPTNVVMKDTKFLTTITLLGAACTWAYRFSGGSLLAAVLTHFVLAYGYMVCLGGYRKTHTPTPMVKYAPPGARGAALEPMPAPKTE